MDDAQPNPPPGLMLRAVRETDAEQLCAMANLPGFRFGTGRLPFTRVETTRAWLARLPEGGVNLVAEVGGVLVGSAGLDRFGGRRAHAGLVHLGVHDGWTGRGVGHALLGALTDTADRWLGLRRLELTVYTDNARGVALYRRHGFEVEGTLRQFALRDGMYVDAFAMGRVGKTVV